MDDIMKKFNLYFLDIIKEHYVDFKGRSGKAEFWFFVLFNFVVSFILGKISFWIGNIYSLAIILPAISIGVRRMHDVGKSGWYLLIPIYDIILAIKDGEVEENKWGPAPTINEEA